MHLGQFIAIPAVAYDGTHYRAYHQHGGLLTLDRWIVDDNASVVDQAVLWETGDIDGSVAVAFASVDRELIVVHGWHTVGIPCPTFNEHRFDRRGKTVAIRLSARHGDGVAGAPPRGRRRGRCHRGALRGNLCELERRLPARRSWRSGVPPERV